MSNYHTSVLLYEAVDFLKVESGKRFIDATLGGGGHTTKILENGGRVLGIDSDKDALEFVEKKFRIQNSEFKIGTDLVLVRGNFRDIDEIARANGFTEIDGVLFDLGVSSHQLDEGVRGFSIRLDGPLDMRMDQELSVKAADLIQGLTKNELSELFFKLGEERHARQLAGKIVEARKVSPITTTGELSQIIEKSIPNFGKVHPATRIFQALRIAVNDELNSLKDALPKAFELLKPGGRLVVISFHSLEDRIVKEYFVSLERNQLGKIITDKPVVPSDFEIAQNPRSRSSKLRVIEKGAGE